MRGKTFTVKREKKSTKTITLFLICKSRNPNIFQNFKCLFCENANQEETWMMTW